mgnify:CR=1 FL=1
MRKNRLYKDEFCTSNSSKIIKTSSVSSLSYIYIYGIIENVVKKARVKNVKLVVVNKLKATFRLEYGHDCKCDNLVPRAFLRRGEEGREKTLASADHVTNLNITFATNLC